VGEEWGEKGAVGEWVVEPISAADRVSEGWDKRGIDISGMLSILWTNAFSS
jgi:hypothetical protein